MRRSTAVLASLLLLVTGALFGVLADRRLTTPPAQAAQLEQVAPNDPFACATVGELLKVTYVLYSDVVISDIEFKAVADAFVSLSTLMERAGMPLPLLYTQDGSRTLKPIAEDAYRRAKEIAEDWCEVPDNDFGAPPVIGKTPAGASSVGDTMRAPHEVSRRR